MTKLSVAGFIARLFWAGMATTAVWAPESVYAQATPASLEQTVRPQPMQPGDIQALAAARASYSDPYNLYVNCIPREPRYGASEKAKQDARASHINGYCTWVTTDGVHHYCK